MPLRALALTGLAAVWMLLQDEVSVRHLLLGYLAAGLALAVVGGGPRGPLPVRALVAAMRLAGRLALEVVRSSAAVARLVLAPGSATHPGIVAVPLDLRSPAAVATLGAAATLTPGTIVLGTSRDGERLYVHAVDARDPEAVRRAVKWGLERHLARLERAALEGSRD